MKPSPEGETVEEEDGETAEESLEEGEEEVVEEDECVEGEEGEEAEEEEEEEEEGEDDQEESAFAIDAQSAAQSEAEPEPPKAPQQAHERKTTPLRNSVTNKRDWDTFVRSKGRFKVHDYFQSSKLECFNMWLDSGKDWDQVALEVERIHSNEVKAKRGWVAVQGTKLIKQRGEEKARKIINARREQGQFYPDEDFPEDHDAPRSTTIGHLVLEVRFINLWSLRFVSDFFAIK